MSCLTVKPDKNAKLDIKKENGRSYKRSGRNYRWQNEMLAVYMTKKESSKRDRKTRI